jgi:hypothetical protein
MTTIKAQHPSTLPTKKRYTATPKVQNNYKRAKGADTEDLDNASIRVSNINTF